MTSHTRTRAINACRHIHHQLIASAVILEANARITTCETAKGTMLACAREYRRLAAIIIGDIEQPA